MLGMATTSPLALLCGASDHVGLGLRVDGLEHRIEGFGLSNFTYSLHCGSFFEFLFWVTF